MSGLNQVLIEELQKHGLEARISSISHLDDIKEEIASLKKQSMFDEKFYNEYLSSRMEYNYLDSMPGAKSIIIIAYPQLSTHLKFEYHGKNHTIIIPATYIYSEAFKCVENIVNQVLAPCKYNMEVIRLPLKQMAVRSGLATYGKNNIAYIKGMGSFHRLFAVITDMPCNEDHWRETTVMPECSNCNACTKVCPTSAIDGQRFLIRAEKCITFMNERAGDFPEWFDKSWHNSLVGCMSCQAICPKNREFIHKSEKEIIFIEEEVETLLQNTPLEQIPVQLKQKLDSLNMMEYYDVIGRNLSVLIS